MGLKLWQDLKVFLSVPDWRNSNDDWRASDQERQLGMKLESLLKENRIHIIGRVLWTGGFLLLNLIV